MYGPDGPLLASLVAEVPPLGAGQPVFDEYRYVSVLSYFLLQYLQR